jgi:hypothetical protein
VIKFVEELQQKFGTVYIALYSKQELLACSSAYLSIHETDR